MKWRLRNIGALDPRGSRRNTITADDMVAVNIVSVLIGATAATAGSSPTGNLAGDLLVTSLFAGAVSWMAASASWWSLVVGGAAVMVASGGWLAAGFGATAALVGLWLGDRRVSMPWARSVGAGFAVHGALRLGVNPFFAASALVATAVVVFLLIVSLRRRPRARRRRYIRVLLVGALVAPIAGGGFLIGAVAARDDVEIGYRELLAGLDHLEQGDSAAAVTTFRAAADALQRADNALSAPWVQPARLLPVVAQHRDAIADVVSAAATAARAVADALQLVDFDALTIAGGRVDVDELALLAGPLGTLNETVHELEGALVASESPWLVESLSRRLGRYLDRVSSAARQSTVLRLAAERGPSLLGADGERTYFVGFTSTAEARSLIGVMGNYALLRVSDGQLEVTEFGRINDLRNATEDNGAVVLEASPEYFARYRAYGAGDGTSGAPANPSFWSNVTMTPDMPTAGPIIAQLWAASGGAPIDGVLLLGPEALAGLLQATGPITVDGLDTPLDAGSVEQFLLRDQYQLDTPERRDLLEDVAEATLDALLTGLLPPPQRLAQALGPSAGSGQLLMWTTDPDDAELLRLMSIDGALPRPAGRDGLAVVTNNGTANKIDSFLQRSVEYHAEYDRSSGRVTGTIEIRLRNTAPASGFPDYVIGTEFLDLPLGTNRTLLSVYTPLNAVDVSIDGRPLGYNRSAELGWNVVSATIDLGPGEEVLVTITVDGIVSPDGAPGTYELVLRPQAMALDDELVIEVGGDTSIRVDGGGGRTRVLGGRDE